MSTVTFVSLNCSCPTFLGDQHGSLVTLFLKSILYTLQPKMIGVSKTRQHVRTRFVFLPTFIVPTSQCTHVNFSCEFHFLMYLWARTCCQLSMTTRAVERRKERSAVRLACITCRAVERVSLLSNRARACQPAWDPNCSTKPKLTVRCSHVRT
jgi:hypothetical protein